MKGMVVGLKIKFTRVILMVLLLAAAVNCFWVPVAYASEVTTTTTSTPPPTVVVAESDTQTLGSISFRASNSKRVPVGKSVTLYVKIEDMAGTVVTSFTCSNPNIATIEKINNVSVRVTGVKQGEVVITATAGGKSAKYTLIVGDADVTSVVPSQSQTASAAAEEQDSVYADIYEQEFHSEVAELANRRKENSAGSIILGIIGLGVIIGGLGTVLSVMFSNHTPKLTLYPGSRRRFNAGASKGKIKKRLLPDHYYRNIKKKY